jgi:hypothetical protein
VVFTGVSAIFVYKTPIFSPQVQLAGGAGGSDESYTWTMTVSKGGRVATVQAPVVVTPGVTLPTVRIAALRDSKVNSGSKLSIRGSVAGSSGGTPAWGWSVHVAGGGQLDVHDAAVAAVTSSVSTSAAGGTATTLALFAGVLRPVGGVDTKYTVVLSASDQTGVASAQVDIVVNAPPRPSSSAGAGGAALVTLSPEAVEAGARVALATDPALWVDLDAPLMYQWSWRHAGDNSSAPTLLTDFSAAPSTEVILPPGQEEGGRGIELELRVRDSRRAVSDPVAVTVLVGYPQAGNT